MPSGAVRGVWAALWQRLSQGFSPASRGLYDNREHTGFSPSPSGKIENLGMEENLSFFLLGREPWWPPLGPSLWLLMSGTSPTVG